MGDLDVKPFHAAAMRKYTSKEVEEKTLKLCSIWEDNLRDPGWHPFKVIVDKEGTAKVRILADQEQLVLSKEFCGWLLYPLSLMET